MALAPNSKDSQLTLNNRVLQGVSRQELNSSRSTAPKNKKFDPMQSSKRRFRRGSDPIHNRS